MKLVYKGTQCEVKIGDKVTTRFGPDEVADFRPPHKPSSSGKVSLRSGGEYYVSVIGAEWIEREDRGLSHPNYQLP